MAIWNLGSINIDHVLRVPHLPTPGETVMATGAEAGLGGKGANHSVAAARAGAAVHHLGAVGPDGAPWLAQLAEAGVDVSHVARVAAPTGRAEIRVDGAGENSIVVLAGANAAVPEAAVLDALAQAGPGDTLLMQNETNGQRAAAQAARARGLRVVCSAAPFDAGVTLALMPFCSVLIVNAVEAEQLAAALGRPVGAGDLPVLVVTRGAAGAEWCDFDSGEQIVQRPPPVRAVDTTGAGDCLAGYLCAGLDTGLDPAAALRRAVAAAALSVTQAGAAASIPKAAAVTALLAR